MWTIRYESIYCYSVAYYRGIEYYFRSRNLLLVYSLMKEDTLHLDYMILLKFIYVFYGYDQFVSIKYHRQLKLCSELALCILLLFVIQLLAIFLNLSREFKKSTIFSLW